MRAGSRVWAGSWREVLGPPGSEGGGSRRRKRRGQEKRRGPRGGPGRCGRLRGSGGRQRDSAAEVKPAGWPCHARCPRRVLRDSAACEPGLGPRWVPGGSGGIVQRASPGPRAQGLRALSRVKCGVEAGGDCGPRARGHGVGGADSLELQPAGAGARFVGSVIS